MHQSQKYATMVIYVEACESGSMFDGLLNNTLNVYAMTASTPFESSYACYDDPTRNTYLGDTFSVNWLENSTPFHVESESVSDQFNIDRIETKQSTVCQYGNLSIAESKLQAYLSSQNVSKRSVSNFRSVSKKNVLDSRFVQQLYYKRRGMDKEYFALLHKMEAELNYFKKYYVYREVINTCFAEKPVNSRCIQAHIELMEKHVGRLTDYGLSMLKHYIPC